MCAQSIQRRGVGLASTLLLSMPVVVGAEVDLDWHAPAATRINNLTQVLNGEGVYGFIYNTSHTPDDQYGTYNWCNMPHVRKQEYVQVSDGFELKYVEVIHRHHKRTPYADNSFPVESYNWNCDDIALFYTGEPNERHGNTAAKAYLSHFQAAENHFTVEAEGFQGTCQFPQITAEGLDDSYVHGKDLYGVYHDLLKFLPSHTDNWQSEVQYRVTNNLITSQVAGMVINGMWKTSKRVPLLVDPDGIDSLMPQAFCQAGEKLFSQISSPDNEVWGGHLSAAKDLYSVLDDLSGVPSDDEGFHKSFDHYYDNLSARQCHSKPLPCKLVSGKNDTSDCFTQDLAESVYRLGHWEYSRQYRDASESLAATASTYGTWISTLANHLRGVIKGTSDTIYFHNVAHDGSVSRLLSILQINEMVWPGMGAEVVFELFKKTTNLTPLNDIKHRGSKSESGFYVRVLFGGQVLKSSNPSLGEINLIPVETLLDYFDGLAGKDASKVQSLCGGNSTVVA